MSALPLSLGLAGALLAAHCMAAESDALDAPAPRVTFERAPVEGDILLRRDAQGREMNELAGPSIRWWKRRGRSEIGVGVGSLSYVPAADAPGAGPLLAPMPSVTLGWRYRLDRDTAFYADATGLRAQAADGSMPGIVNAKVGVEWKPATSRFGFENRALGVQLQSGYRMSLRLRKGGVGVYLRGQF